jgi:hypothetical protein
MIELTLKNYNGYDEGLLLLNNILQWVAAYVASKKDEKIVIDGTLCVYDSIKPRVAALIMCEGFSEKKINELLQNPPGEYKEKYIACVVSEEPEVVTENNTDESCTDKKEEQDGQAAAT